MRRDQFSVIGVMGTGVVGGSLLLHLRTQGRDVRPYDPPKGLNDATALDEADVMFVCVPTPYSPGIGFDNSFLVDAISRIPGQKCVVIKSTVLPGTTQMMQDRFPQHRFLFNPEFLREATALDDFVNPDRQFVGLTSGATQADAEAVMVLMPRAPLEVYCSAMEAEMAKYVANSFLAVKVSYANEVYDLCERLRIEYSLVRDMVAADLRIGASHMDVHDGGYRGYGGKCLPKDSKSLLDLARSLGVRMDVLSAADRVNAALRPEFATPVLPRLAADPPDVELEERAA